MSNVPLSVNSGTKTAKSFAATKGTVSRESESCVPVETRIGRLEAKIRQLEAAANEISGPPMVGMKKGTPSMKMGEKQSTQEGVKQAPTGQYDIPEYDNSVTYAKCDRVFQNGFVWQMIDASGEPGYSPPTDGSESNNQWVKRGSPALKAACPQAGGRRASRRRHPKKKATRRR